MRWPGGSCKAAASEEDDVGFVADEAQLEEFAHFQFVDLGPGPVEAFEGLDDGEPCLGDSAGGGAVLALAELAFE